MIQQLTSSCGINEDQDGVLCRLLRADLGWHRLYPCIFTLWIWNQHDNVLACLPISSNLADGWNNAFRCLVDIRCIPLFDKWYTTYIKCLMGCSNSKMWRFIDVLKKEQDLTDWKINQDMTRQPLLLNRRSERTSTDRCTTSSCPMNMMTSRGLTT